LSENKPISALILAAGNSERMGQSKASLSYGNGLTFAGQIISVYLQSGCVPVTMVINNRFNAAIPESDKVQLILNKHVERGRSWSVWLGLQNTPEGHSCFIQNVDNPFVDTGILQQMCKVIRPKRYIVPVFEGKGGHPILLGSKVVDDLRKRSDLQDFRDLLKEFKRFEVLSSDERVHLNINTPGDYRNFINPDQS
jgi:molybdenum cofactor cytidylyltransferase